MRLTRHRSEFNLEMSSEDVNMLALLLKCHFLTVKLMGDEIETTSTKAYLQEFIAELTKYQREAEAYDRYLEKEHQ